MDKDLKFDSISPLPLTSLKLEDMFALSLLFTHLTILTQNCCSLVFAKPLLFHIQYMDEENAPIPGLR